MNNALSKFYITILNSQCFYNKASMSEVNMSTQTGCVDSSGTLRKFG